MGGNKEKYYVVVGSLNIDLVANMERMPKKGETILGTGFGLFPGGKGANQAAQLGRLHAKTYMVGRVGSDVFAPQLTDSLEAAGVLTDYVVRDPRNGTGKACIFTDAAGDNCIVVISEANMAWVPGDLERARALIEGAAIVVLQLEIPPEVVEGAAKIAHDAGVPVLLNPAPARPLPDSLLAMVDYLAPNETEAAALSGVAVTGVESAKEAAFALLKRGPKAVIITLGSEGAVIADENGAEHIPPFVVNAIDATAAGDSFCAALAYGLAGFEDRADALRFASAAGALTVTRMGAQPSLPTLEEVRAFLKQGAGA